MIVLFVAWKVTTDTPTRRGEMSTTRRERLGRPGSKCRALVRLLVSCSNAHRTDSFDGKRAPRYDELTCRADGSRGRVGGTLASSSRGVGNRRRSSAKQAVER